MKSNTYKWIIGCLIGIIVILVTYLILKEMTIIYFSFPEALSLTATISSLILSVIAMLYTYYSGRDTSNISTQIQSTIKEIDKQVQKVSEDTRKNSETLIKMMEGMELITQAINLSSDAVETFKMKDASEEARKVAIERVEKSKNSMLMFLNKMQEKD